MRDEDPRLGGEPDAAPGWLKQRDPSFGFELAELLGDRRRAVRQGPGHGRESAQAVKLAQQAQAVHVKHAMLALLLTDQFCLLLSLKNIRWTKLLHVGESRGMRTNELPR